jgi:hypothetical protein
MAGKSETCRASAWQSQSTRLVTWLGHSFVSLFEDFVDETREAEAALQ